MLMKVHFFKLLKGDAAFTALRVCCASLAGVCAGLGCFTLFVLFSFNTASINAQDEACRLFESNTAVNFNDPALSPELATALVDTHIVVSDPHRHYSYADPEDLALHDELELVRVKGLKKRISPSVYAVRFDKVK